MSKREMLAIAKGVGMSSVSEWQCYNAKKRLRMEDERKVRSIADAGIRMKQTHIFFSTLSVSLLV